MSTERPLLSLILCSRNDRYMGNSRWRLETSLALLARELRALDRLDAVEVIVTDWGSDVPLHTAIELEPAAARIVRFLVVPSALARTLQRDSPFPEVLALNAAARRARGQFIGRIDQDTIVGRRFLEWVFADTPDACAWFSTRRSIPYRFAVQCPQVLEVARALRWTGARLAVERSEAGGEPFYARSVGIWMMPAVLWQECGGYDESLVYMNDMEVDMAERLRMRHPLLDLGPRVEHAFYHLDHYHPSGPQSSSAHRRVNRDDPKRAREFHPNGDDWGLAAHDLDFARPQRVASAAAEPGATAATAITRLLGCGVHTAADRLRYRIAPRTANRGRKALALLRTGWVS